MLPLIEPDQVVDTTGGGDAFVAALTWALDRGEDPVRAGQLATAAAGLVVRHPGGRPALKAATVEEWATRLRGAEPMSAETHLSGRAVAASREPSWTRAPGPDRVAVRPVQRTHRGPGQPRRGRASRSSRDVPELLLRVPRAELPGVGVRVSRVGSERGQRSQRQARPAARRRRAVRRAVRPAAAARAHPRLPGRHSAAGGGVADPGRSAGADPDHPSGLLQPARHSGYPVRGGAGGARRPDRSAVRAGRERADAGAVGECRRR